MPVYGATPGVPDNAAKFGLPKTLPAGVPVNADKFAFAKIPDAGATEATTLGARVEAATGRTEAAVPVAAPPTNEASRELVTTDGAAAAAALDKTGIAAPAIIIPLTNVI
jgi:hypothetical protein